MFFGPAIFLLFWRVGTASANLITSHGDMMVGMGGRSAGTIESEDPESRNAARTGTGGNNVTFDYENGDAVKSLSPDRLKVLPGKPYADGVHCLTGQAPHTKEEIQEFQKFKKYREDVKVQKSFSAEQWEKTNTELTEQAGPKACKTGRCKMDMETSTPICSGHVIKPGLGLVCVLLAWSFIRFLYFP